MQASYQFVPTTISRPAAKATAIMQGAYELLMSRTTAMHLREGAQTGWVSNDLSERPSRRGLGRGLVGTSIYLRSRDEERRVVGFDLGTQPDV